MPLSPTVLQPWPWTSCWGLCGAIYPSWRKSGWLRLRLWAQMMNHLRVHRLLSESLRPLPVASLANAMPRVFRKIYSPYPCSGLTVDERARHLAGHYRWALQCLGATGLDKLRRAFEGDVSAAHLVQVPLPKGQGMLQVDLMILTRFEREGDLCLVLRDPFGTALFTLAFSFETTPEGRTGLLIGAVHGALPVAVARHLTKLCHGLRPPHLLFWVLQQQAAQWGVVSLRGVGSRRHVLSGTEREERVRFDYDAFWRDVGGVADAQGMFILPLQAVQRTAADIPSHKRAFYQRRYAWLREIQARFRVQLRRAA